MKAKKQKHDPHEIDWGAEWTVGSSRSVFDGLRNATAMRGLCRFQIHDGEKIRETVVEMQIGG